MQELLLEEDPSTMTEQRIELVMVQRIDSEQKATATRVDTIEASLHNLEREVSEINGKMKPPAETAWWIKSIIAPLCVAAAVAMVGSVIALLVQVHGIQTYLHDNSGFIAGLRLQQNSAAPMDQANISEVKAILRHAKADKVNIPPQIIQDVGNKFINAAQSYPDAWGAALAFLDYKAFLNPASLPPVVKIALKEKWSTTKYYRWYLQTIRKPGRS